MFKKQKFKKAIVVSYLAMFVEGALNTVLVALMVVLAKRFNKDVGDIAMLVSYKSLGTLFVLFISGALSDRLGRKLPIIVGGILFGIFILGFIFVKNYNYAIALAFIGGLAHGFMDTPAMSLLFDIFVGNTGPAMSVVQLFFSGGGVFTSLLASWFIKDNLDYRIIFMIILALNVGLLVVAFMAAYPLISRHKGKKALIIYENKPKIYREGLLLLFSTITAASYTSIVMTWLPTYLNVVKGIDNSLAVSGLSFYQIGAVSGSLVFALVLKRYHTTQIIAVNPLFGIIVFGLLLFSNNLVIMFCLIGLSGVFMGLFFSLCINMGGELFMEYAGTITGLVASSSMLGGTVVIWLSGKLVGDVGVDRIIVFAVVLLGLLLILGNIFRFSYLKLKPRRNYE